MGKDEVSKSTLRADLGKLALVSGVDLEAKASCRKRQTHYNVSYTSSKNNSTIFVNAYHQEQMIRRKK